MHCVENMNITEAEYKLDDIWVLYFFKVSSEVFFTSSMLKDDIYKNEHDKWRECQDPCYINVEVLTTFVLHCI